MSLGIALLNWSMDTHEDALGAHPSVPYLLTAGDRVGPLAP